MHFLEVSHLTFSYNGQENVIKDVSFFVEKGSYTTIIGHNGSGKSTIAKLLAGLLEIKSGSITYDGIPLDQEHLNQIRDMVGIVFQNPDNQFIGSTVADDIAFGLENQQVPTEKMQAVLERFAREVNMLDFLDKEPGKLSGGQKQRVAIAGVLAMSPEILILDEATSMLDPKGKKEINQLVGSLHKEKKMTVIAITHDIEEAAKSDEVIVLNQGEIAMMGSPKEILTQSSKLQKLSLEAPFAVHCAEIMQQSGHRIGAPVTMEGLVEALCQLHAKG